MQNHNTESDTTYIVFLTCIEIVRSQCICVPLLIFEQPIIRLSHGKIHLQ